MKKQLHILDLDDTLIRSGHIIGNCHIKGLEQLTKTKGIKVTREYLQEEWKKTRNQEGYTVDDILLKMGSSIAEFYKTCYQTFAPQEEAQKGTLFTFPDAQKFLERTSQENQVIITNYSATSAQNKMAACNIGGFAALFAGGKEIPTKPNTTLGEMGLAFMQENGMLTDSPEIICVGDLPSDITFYNRLKQFYPGIQSVLIDREYNGVAYNADKVVHSMVDLL